MNCRFSNLLDEFIKFLLVFEHMFIFCEAHLMCAKVKHAMQDYITQTTLYPMQKDGA